MNVDGKPTRTIRPAGDDAVEIIDQTALPQAFVVRQLRSAAEVAGAIASMQVRGAPLIGAAAAYGIWLAMRADASDAALAAARAMLLVTRPTAVNLRWALDTVVARIGPLPPAARAGAARAAADAIADDDVAINRAIGEHGRALIDGLARARPARPINVLTHCNAGWLATVDWGTALAGVYAAHDAGVPVHVWVDETRPRNQGAALTAWELGAHGVPHTVIVDNAGGHLMQRGDVDVVLVGTDRTTAAGDVVNKIGTYLKALAARDCGVPFYVAAPSPSIDWTIDAAGAAGIPIEERSADEVTTVAGTTAAGDAARVQVTPPGSRAHNPGFDVTPARLVTGIITERGVAPASREGLARLFPERAAGAKGAP
ncbi:MAG TPA: S-methyl-5-thioribose-1-phosphate isomerase [Polyangia bacterium]|nr:S-methyl-5-thioribose-1-phosphate isomerase [Polyangia bacterium]